VANTLSAFEVASALSGFELASVENYFGCNRWRGV